MSEKYPDQKIKNSYASIPRVDPKDVTVEFYSQIPRIRNGGELFLPVCTGFNLDKWWLMCLEEPQLTEMSHECRVVTEIDANNQEVTCFLYRLLPDLSEVMPEGWGD